MRLIQLSDPKSSKAFLKVPLHIYKDDPSFIRPLDKDINEVFDPKKNKTYRFGESARWLLTDDDGNLIGRIAAFVNRKYKNKGDEQPTGGVGFLNVSITRKLQICYLMLPKAGLCKEAWKLWMAL